MVLTFFSVLIQAGLVGLLDPREFAVSIGEARIHIVHSSQSRSSVPNECIHVHGEEIEFVISR